MLIVLICTGAFVLCLVLIAMFYRGRREMKHHQQHKLDDFKSNSKSKTGQSPTGDNNGSSTTQALRSGSINRPSIPIGNMDKKRDIISSASNSPVSSRDNSLMRNIDIAGDIEIDSDNQHMSYPNGVAAIDIIDGIDAINDESRDGIGSLDSSNSGIRDRGKAKHIGDDNKGKRMLRISVKPQANSNGGLVGIGRGGSGTATVVPVLTPPPAPMTPPAEDVAQQTRESQIGQTMQVELQQLNDSNDNDIYNDNKNDNQLKMDIENGVSNDL